MGRDMVASASTKRKAERENTRKVPSQEHATLWEPSAAKEGTKIDEPKQRKEPVLPWMRHPVEVDSFQELPLELVPCLDPRKALSAFRAGDVEVLVAFDAMTRGMDVEGVMNVVNYDMPSYAKTFVHRAGRTARAGRSRCCFTLLRREEVKRFRRILEKADNNKSSSYTLPADLIEKLHPSYSAALEKLKEIVKSETTGHHRTSSKLVVASKTEEWIETADDTRM